MLENAGNKPCIQTSSLASMMKPQQVPQSQNFLGIPREKQRFTINDPKKDIQPGMRNDAEIQILKKIRIRETKLGESQRRKTIISKASGN